MDPAVIHTLVTCEWVRKGLPLCLIGDSGTGKSHLLIALGTEAAMAGYRVLYKLATKLVNELVQAADEKVLTKTFTDPRLCAAIVDRLTFGGNLIQTGTDSYRLAITQARAAAQDGKAG
ncbi:DNA replication protein DnaC [Streptomyces sp. V4I2]|nr:DNA replication protein DnaC [Streptomyces sp. V4I2]